jgi:type III pantothenate kinase
LRLPFKNLYKTPETLGTDRLAAAAGAFSHFPDTNVLVIDAGTAITYEFMEPGLYLGGNISPGLMIRFRALHRFTGKLPLVNPSSGYEYPGQTTTSAIATGVIRGMIYEINEYIRTFEKKYADTRIILTGGDGDFFRDKLLKEVLYMPDLVMEGLNFILEYNAK